MTALNPGPNLYNDRAIAPVLFHLAFPVANIPDTKRYYIEGLGCHLGRESPNSAILNLYGHQLVAHVSRETLTPQNGIYPRHFGLVFTQERDWQDLVNRVERQNLGFHQAPRRRFVGEPLDHHTAFLEDPFHNLLEFKYYFHAEAIFGLRGDRRIGDAQGDAQAAAEVPKGQC